MAVDWVKIRQKQARIEHDIKRIKAEQKVESLQRTVRLGREQGKTAVVKTASKRLTSAKKEAEKYQPKRTVTYKTKSGKTQTGTVTTIGGKDYVISVGKPGELEAPALKKKPTIRVKEVKAKVVSKPRVSKVPVLEAIKVPVREVRPTPVLRAKLKREPLWRKAVEKVVKRVEPIFKAGRPIVPLVTTRAIVDVVPKPDLKKLLPSKVREFVEKVEEELAPAVAIQRRLGLPTPLMPIPGIARAKEISKRQRELYERGLGAVIAPPIPPAAVEEYLPKVEPAKPVVLPVEVEKKRAEKVTVARKISDLNRRINEYNARPFLGEVATFYGRGGGRDLMKEREKLVTSLKVTYPDYQIERLVSDPLKGRKVVYKDPADPTGKKVIKSESGVTDVEFIADRLLGTKIPDTDDVVASHQTLTFQIDELNKRADVLKDEQIKYADKISSVKSFNEKVDVLNKEAGAINLYDEAAVIAYNNKLTALKTEKDLVVGVNVEQFEDYNARVDAFEKDRVLVERDIEEYKLDYNVLKEIDPVEIAYLREIEFKKSEKKRLENRDKVKTQLDTVEKDLKSKYGAGWQLKLGRARIKYPETDPRHQDMTKYVTLLDEFQSLDNPAKYTEAKKVENIFKDIKKSYDERKPIPFGEQIKMGTQMGLASAKYDKLAYLQDVAPIVKPLVEGPEKIKQPELKIAAKAGAGALKDIVENPEVNAAIFLASYGAGYALKKGGIAVASKLADKPVALAVSKGLGIAGAVGLTAYGAKKSMERIDEADDKAMKAGKIAKDWILVWKGSRIGRRAATPDIRPVSKASFKDIGTTKYVDKVKHTYNTVTKGYYTSKAGQKIYYDVRVKLPEAGAGKGTYTVRLSNPRGKLIDIYNGRLDHQYTLTGKADDYKFVFETDTKVGRLIPTREMTKGSINVKQATPTKVEYTYVKPEEMGIFRGDYRYAGPMIQKTVPIKTVPGAPKIQIEMTDKLTLTKKFLGPKQAWWELKEATAKYQGQRFQETVTSQMKQRGVIPKQSFVQNIWAGVKKHFPSFRLGEMGKKATVPIAGRPPSGSYISPKTGAYVGLPPDTTRVGVFFDPKIGVVRGIPRVGAKEAISIFRPPKAGALDITGITGGGEIVGPTTAFQAFAPSIPGPSPSLFMGTQPTFTPFISPEIFAPPAELTRVTAIPDIRAKIGTAVGLMARPAAIMDVSPELQPLVIPTPVPPPPVPVPPEVITETKTIVIEGVAVPVVPVLAALPFITRMPKVPLGGIPLLGGFPRGKGVLGRFGKGVREWNVENKIRDFAGEWIQRQRKKSPAPFKRRTPKQALIQFGIGPAKVVGLPKKVTTLPLPKVPTFDIKKITGL